MEKVILLGPQRHNVTVGETIRSLELEGPFAAITAGWQEREGEVEELDASVGEKTINLLLHRRSEQIFRVDKELRTAHRRHQESMKRLQEIYWVRLKSALDTVHLLMRRRQKYSAGLLDPEIDDAIAVVSDIDRHHLDRIREMKDAFEEQWDPASRELVAAHRAQVTEILDRCSALLIAGGHVAVLLNRIRLLQLEPLIREMPIIAWSAGAMVLGSQVVLFHDTPPQGPGYAEVFETGLDIFDDILPLPHARQRLKLDDPDRVSIFARRFAHLHCLALESSSRLDGEERWTARTNIFRLMETGLLQDLEEACL